MWFNRCSESRFLWRITITIVHYFYLIAFKMKPDSWFCLELAEKCKSQIGKVHESRVLRFRRSEATLSQKDFPGSRLWEKIQSFVVSLFLRWHGHPDRDGSMAE